LYLPDAEIDFLLDEDARFGDLIVGALAIGEMAEVSLAAHQELILCGSDKANLLFTPLGASVIFAVRQMRSGAPGRLSFAQETPCHS